MKFIILFVLLTNIFTFTLDNLQKTEEELQENIFPGLQTNALNIQVNRIWDINHFPDKIRMDYRTAGIESWCGYLDINNEIILGSPIPRRWHRLEFGTRRDAAAFATEVQISYTQDGVNWLNPDYEDTIKANSEINVVKVKQFATSYYAKAIKLRPLHWFGHVCMKLEAYISDVDTIIRKRLPRKIGLIHNGIGLVSTSGTFDPSCNKVKLDISQKLNFGCLGWVAPVNDLNQWIQVSLVIPRKIVSVATRRRYDAGNQMVKSYRIKYTLDGVNWKYADNARVFEGNADNTELVTNKFIEPFEARAVRLEPLTWGGMIALQMELYASECEN